MGLFDKFFSRKPAPQPTGKTSSVEQNSFLTNSDSFGFNDFKLGISGKVRVDGILAIAEFQKRAEAAGIACKYEVMYTSLLEEGALTVPIAIQWGERYFSLYFIYQEEDLLKYKDLVNHVGKTAYPNLIYFSSIPIYEGYTPKPIIEPFQLADLRFEKEAQLKGTYAMWWSSGDELFFHESATADSLSKLYEVIQGYETYMLGYVLRQTRVKEEAELKRMKLPESNYTFAIHAPEAKKIILEISQEKGIRFLFPVKEVTKQYRERFLKGVLIDFLAFRLDLQKNDMPTDEKTDPNSYDWFSFMSRMVKDKELNNDKIEMIGSLERN
jgi:hypothetical protein